MNSERLREIEESAMEDEGDGREEDGANASVVDVESDSDSNGSNSARDDDGSDERTDGDDQVLMQMELSAMHIQSWWRTRPRNTGIKASNQIDDDQVRLECSPVVQVGTGGGGICCGCFGLLGTNTASSTSKNNVQAPEEEMFCSSCMSMLGTRSAMATLASPTLQSPVPKLNVLVQTEAKYQDQLKLLRQQYELLLQQQNEIVERKRLQQETLAIEREAAKQRRKHLQLMFARKRQEEELKLQRFLDGQETGRDNTADPHSTDTDEKRKPKMKKKKPAIKTDLPVAPRPAMALRVQKHKDEIKKSGGSALPGIDVPESKKAPAKPAGLQEVIKNKLASLQCYAQDLTPMVRGAKPKRLPLPPHSIPNNTTQPRRITSNVLLSKPRKKQSSGVRLDPIASNGATATDNRSQHQTSASNQYEEEERVKWHALDLHSSVAKVKHASTSALTPEIKPVSWAVSLGQQVQEEEPRILGHVHRDVRPIAWQTSLRDLTVQEGPEYGVGRPDLRRSSELAWHHAQVPVSVPQHVETTHPMQHSSPTSSVQSIPIQTHGMSTGTFCAPKTSAPAQWEYSSDRLASLLQKYNVSVSTTLPTTTSTMKS